VPETDDTRPIRLLHLSDIHFRADKACDAEPVLRELASFVESEVERTMLLVRHVAYLDWYAGWLGAPPSRCHGGSAAPPITGSRPLHSPRAARSACSPATPSC
jgi:hypothetical protein